MLFSDERSANSQIKNAICKGFPGLTKTPIFDKAHLRYRSQPDLYFSNVDGALVPNCRSMRPGIMSLNEELVNEAASSQIPELRTSERKEKILRKSNNYCANDQKYRYRHKPRRDQINSKHDKTGSKCANSGSKCSKSGSNYTNSGSRYANSGPKYDKSGSKHYP